MANSALFESRCGSPAGARAGIPADAHEASCRPAEARELTFQGFVDGIWRPHLNRRGVKPSTLKSYESGLKNHIQPKLGDLLLIQITPMHIEELLNAPDISRLAAKTKRNLVVLLGSIFELAVEDDLIRRSPVRSKHKPPLVRWEKPVWTAEQIRNIITAIPPPYEALFFTVALTGVRLGELLALQRKHVDLTAATLRVEQSLWNGQLVSPQTPRSVRTIPLGSILKAVLQRHLQRSPHRRPEDFLFSRVDGSPLRPDVLRKDVLYPVLDRLQIPRISRNTGFHCLGEYVCWALEHCHYRRAAMAVERTIYPGIERSRHTCLICNSFYRLSSFK